MKVGDYVRTKKGISRIATIDNEQIRKIIYTDTKEVFEYYTDKQGNEIKDYWKNYLSDIIGLIEVGDYVNGYKILNIEKSDIVDKDGNLIKEKIKLLIGRDMYGFPEYIEEKDIKSIVTKECFESMEYKVKEKIK